MLVVSKSGRKTWVLRYQRGGVRRDMGIGAYPEVSLKDARLKASEDRALKARGIDPIEARRAARKAAKPVPTFGDVARLVIDDAGRRSTSAKACVGWRRYLGPAYCGPLLARPVNAITTLDVAAVLRPVWRAKPESARKLYPAIRRVFDRARIVLRDEHGLAMGMNPALWGDLKAMGFEPPAKLTRGSHPSLPYREMPAFMAALRAEESVAARALEFLILSNVRTDAVLKAQWAEFDLEAALWTLPLVRLKDRKHREQGFRVPLAPQAAAIVRAMNEVRLSHFVFPGQRRDEPPSAATFLRVLKRINEGKWSDPTSGRSITPHGFRASFKTWAEEIATFPHAIVELAMGHQVGGEVERAYMRGDLLVKRRELMNAWADYCEPRAGETVVAFRKAAAREPVNNGGQ
jgi:integrase